MDIDVEIVSVKIRAARTLPCYRTETGESVSYSSDVTDHELVIGLGLPMTVSVADDLTGEACVNAVLAHLNGMVTNNMELAAKAKVNGGVYLALPVKIDYGKRAAGL